MINFYLNPSLEASAISINYHETLYSFLHPDGMFIGDDFLFLKKGKTFPKKFTPYFDEANLLQIFESKTTGPKGSNVQFVVRNQLSRKNSLLINYNK